jgi:glycosyltransferase involved in cell wall biosynthesis
LIYPSLQEGFGVPVLEAMKCNVAVITSENSAMQEVSKDAALYVNPSDHTDIADKMMLLYKDESLRDRLIQKGLTVSEQYSWERSSELLWQCIIKTIK